MYGTIVSCTECWREFIHVVYKILVGGPSLVPDSRSGRNLFWDSIPIGMNRLARTREMSACRFCNNR